MKDYYKESSDNDIVTARQLVEAFRWQKGNNSTELVDKCNENF